MFGIEGVLPPKQKGTKVETANVRRVSSWQTVVITVNKLTFQTELCYPLFFVPSTIPCLGSIKPKPSFSTVAGAHSLPWKRYNQTKWHWQVPCAH